MVVLDIPSDFTLLQYKLELNDLFTELNLIFYIFYRPTMLLNSTSAEMELEAIKNTKSGPDQPVVGVKTSIDIENLNMLHHLLGSL